MGTRATHTPAAALSPASPDAYLMPRAQSPQMARQNNSIPFSQLGTHATAHDGDAIVHCRSMHYFERQMCHSAKYKVL